MGCPLGGERPVRDIKYPRGSGEIYRHAAEGKIILDTTLETKFGGGRGLGR